MPGIMLLQQGIDNIATVAHRMIVADADGGIVDARLTFSACIAWRTVQAATSWGLCYLPRKCVLSSSTSNDENVHLRQPSCEGRSRLCCICHGKRLGDTGRLTFLLAAAAVTQTRNFEAGRSFAAGRNEEARQLETGCAAMCRNSITPRSGVFRRCKHC